MLDIQKSLPKKKLLNTIWAYGPVGSALLTKKFTFNPDGTIGGYSHANERKWSYENGELRIYSERGSVSWVCENLYVENGGLTIVLRHTVHTDVLFELKECTKSGHIGYSGSGAYEAPEFLFPTDLQVTPTGLSRVLLIGSCLTAKYHLEFRQNHPDIIFDYIPFNFAGRLGAPPAPIEQYNFQYIQIPLRSLVSDRIITERRLNDPGFLNEIYRDACAILDAMLESALTYNRAHGLLTFVSNFVVPQMSLAPSLAARGSSQDFTHLVKSLNEYLKSAISDHSNVFLCDVDAVAASVGKRYFLDDVTVFVAHGATFRQSFIDNTWDLQPGSRIEPVPHIDTFYESKEGEFASAIYAQMVAAYRTVRQIDQVKAVVFDLDNTIWRGQIAEHYRPDRRPWPKRGGWQYGLWETVQHLRARGILVAICSKNDLDVVKEHWDSAVDLPFL